MQTFYQWLTERGVRTGLGIYPPNYSAGQYPPLYFTPISATAALSFQTTHKELASNTNPAPKKKHKKKSKKKKK